MITLFSFETTYITLSPADVSNSVTFVMATVRLTVFELGLLSNAEKLPRFMPAIELEELLHDAAEMQAAASKNERNGFIIFSNYLLSF